jgi:hypothetical protein
MIFSFKTLVIGWAGLLTTLGAGAVALQVTQPTAPVLRLASVATIPMPPPIAAPGTPPPVVVPPVPFVNSSLLAMLPPVERAPQPVWPVPHQVASLPVPPVPPAPPRRYARAEAPRRSPRMYASVPEYEARDYEIAGYGQPMSYPRLYAHGRPYTYVRQPQYYAW